jgi:hypothetical protein
MPKTATPIDLPGQLYTYAQTDFLSHELYDLHCN